MFVRRGALPAFIVLIVISRAARVKRPVALHLRHRQSLTRDQRPHEFRLTAHIRRLSTCYQLLADWGVKKARRWAAAEGPWMKSLTSHLPRWGFWVAASGSRLSEAKTRLNRVVGRHQPLPPLPAIALLSSPPAADADESIRPLYDASVYGSSLIDEDLLRSVLDD